MSFLTTELLDKREKQEKQGLTLNREEQDILRQNQESLKPQNHAFTSSGRKDRDGNLVDECFYCRAPRKFHQFSVVVNRDGVREVR